VAYRQTCLRVIEYLRRFGTFWFFLVFSFRFLPCPVSVRD
jgi:hypothetical protein